MGIGANLIKKLTQGNSKGYQTNVDKTNKWEEELNSVYNQINTREKFSYDMNNDAFYKQYAQQYQNNAKLAMQDTVGQISALTGGYGNSYAQTAGQAMYNQTMEGMNDKATELYQLALQQYNAESDRLNNLYAITADQYNTEYNRIRADIADEQWQKSFDESQRQYNLSLALDAAGLVTDTALRGASLALDATQFGASMAFDISRAKASDQQWATELEYQKERDSVSDSQWQAALDYQRERDAVSDIQFEEELAYKYYSKGKDENTTKVSDEAEPINFNDVYSYVQDNPAVSGGIEVLTESLYNNSSLKNQYNSYEEYLWSIVDLVNDLKNEYGV